MIAAFYIVYMLPFSGFKSLYKTNASDYFLTTEKKEVPGEGGREGYRHPSKCYSNQTEYI